MRLSYLTIVFVLFGIFVCHSQEKQQMLFRIINAESKQPVPYATIRFANNRSGTIANVLGDFRIPIRYKKDKDTLIISCIGYSKKRIALNSLPQKRYHTIYLMPKTEELSEVVINSKDKKRLSARQIVIKAIENIEDNYPKDPYSYIAYYRDYQFVNERYINLNESILEAFDQGFQTHKISDSLNKSALYSYQLNTDFVQDTLLSSAIYNDSKQIKDGKMGTSIGNELTLLDIHDPIRNYKSGSFSFVYIFEKDFAKNHKFYKKGSIFLDDEELYKIEFSAKNDLTGYNHRAKGYIYISKEDFAIHRFDYKLYASRIKKTIFTVDVEYKRQENDKMYLNYITFNNNFFILPKGALKIENWKYIKEKNLFVIEFNRVLDTSIKPKTNDVKIFFRDKKLGIKDIYFSSPNTVKVKLKKESSTFLNQQNLDEIALFTLKLKNFKDIQGFEMGKSKVEGYQFRELFVQRVFLNKASNSNLYFVDKGKSLTEAQLNDLDKGEDYWLNSPLKTTDN
ncbi:carboxypeptidase-like regulatory domain-containing protein [Winogradskyella sp. R77965]|uniref:carboxypeptidase-like regulatory domain-containing protein n=1 Tax=Winogradskyella sp. R77965 TaxID=3093872 RepID=UPI0037DDB5A4